jgi:DNA-directed RNA polymerase specialized sigma24 family protein
VRCIAVSRNSGFEATGNNPLSGSRPELRIHKGMPQPPLPTLVDTKEVRPAQTALALKLVSDMDLLRLKALARLYARGLPADVTWEDLVQEALTRVLVGARLVPEGVPMVAFLAGVMRSLRSEQRRRAQARENDVREIELRDGRPGPERALSARQELGAIRQIFAGDTVVLQIIAGLGEGLSAAQICETRGISKTDYESARKRMRRTFLKAGLTWESH